MKEHHLDDFEIAKIQINTAIKLFDEGNWVCAHTLAGAAEGILRRFIEEEGRQTANSILREKASQELDISSEESADLIREALNRFKHGPKHEKGGKMTNKKTMLNEELVFASICMAVNDYLSLTNSITEIMQIFCNKQLPKFLS